MNGGAALHFGLGLDVPVGARARVGGGITGTVGEGSEPVDCGGPWYPDGRDPCRSDTTPHNGFWLPHVALTLLLGR